MKNRHLIMLLTIVFASGLEAQTYNLRFQVENLDASYYDVKVQINGSAAFGNGGSNICFDYNGASLSKPFLFSAHNFTSGYYLPQTLSEPLPGIVSLNIEYEGAHSAGDRVVAEPDWTDIATVRFTIVDHYGSSDLRFRAADALRSPTIQFLDDLSTILKQGTFHPQNTRTLSAEEYIIAPATLKLNGNFPNPVSDATDISFSLPKEADVLITLVDMAGREAARIVSRRFAAGEHSVRFQAKDIPNGNYTYSIIAGSEKRTGTMTIAR